MTEQVSLKIDGIDVSAAAGTSILEAALSAGIDIPHLCYEPALGLPPTGSCRLCVVEIEGRPGLVASCCHPVAPDMVVHTDTEEIQAIRRAIVELLLSDCPQECLVCESCGECQLQKYAYELGVEQTALLKEPVRSEPIQDGPAIIYDRSKCILCGRCVEVCHNIEVTGAIDFLGRGFDTRIL